MLKTMIRISWLNLKRDYVALGLSFILPIVFFSIFAAIFSGTSGGGSEGKTVARVKCFVLDLDHSTLSKRFVKTLLEEPNLEILSLSEVEEPEPADSWTRETAWRQVRRGGAPVALVFPEDFGEKYSMISGDSLPVELIYDPSNAFARFAVSGLLQAVAMKAAPDVLMEEGMSYLDKFGGGLTVQQQTAIAEMKGYLSGEKTYESNAETGSSSSEPVAMTSLIQVKNTDVQAIPDPDSRTAKKKKITSASMVSYYAAAIGVMFLLFSMTGAAGSILEEEESGTMERLLTAKLSMTQLLLGKWTFFSTFGFIQVMIMFVWAALFFGLPLWDPLHFVGCLLVSACTAAAAGAFGILLATLCKSRAQLGGISTIVILVMSAMGGSMVPRMFMPEFMQKLGHFTFNGQALDAYLKIFWQFDPSLSTWQNLASSFPQIGIMLGMTVAGLLFARLLARRWETC